MKRIALLGATGSIGRQAIEVIDANPELELVAATSGSQPIDGLAPLTQTGGDPSELLERAEPDVVLNAVVGFAGLVPTMWALERGVTLALANKESLVAAGDARARARKRGKGALIPVDSEHSALFQCAQLGEPESIVLTASGGPFRGRTREELVDVTPEEALAHPTWTMGPKITIDSATLANKGLEVIEAHFLFGVPYDRIEVVIHPPSIVHGLVRFHDGAAIAHLGNPDMRVPISYALTYPERAATPVPPLELRTLEFHDPGCRHLPDAPARLRGRKARWNLPLRLQRGQRGRSAGVPGRADRLPRHRRGRRGRTGAGRRRARRRPGRARRGGSPRPRARLGGRDVSFGVAILGLAVLDPDPRGRSLRRRPAVGMTPRKFYLGFGPPIVKTVRNGVEYGIGSLPLGGYVKIPGMHRPAPGDLRATLKPDERPSSASRSTRWTARSSEATRRPRAEQLPKLEPPAGEEPTVPRSSTAALARRLLAPEGVEAHRRDRGGPADEHRLRDRPLRPPSSWSARPVYTRQVEQRPRRPSRRRRRAARRRRDRHRGRRTACSPTRSRSGSMPRTASPSRSSFAATGSAS